jgi:hypothetical protein
MSATWPFPTLAAFERAHFEYRRHLLGYVTTGRGRVAAPTSFLIQNMLHEAAHRESSIHPFVRIGLARLLLPSLQAETKNASVQYVSIAPKSAFVRLQGRHHEAVLSLRDLAKNAFAGLNFVGFVEPGLFDEWALRPDGPPRVFQVSWHFHAIVWADRGTDINDLVMQRTADLTAADPTLKAVDVRSVRPEQLIPRALYMAKLPRSGYRMAPKTPAASGHIPAKVPSDSVGVLKRKLQPGEKLRVLMPLAQIRMRELVVSGGAGSRIVAGCFSALRPEVELLVDRANDEHQLRAQGAEA